MTRRILLIGMSCFILGLAVAIALRQHSYEHGAHDAGKQMTPDLQPAKTAELIDQPLRGLGNEATTLAAVAAGERLLVNFWATWCAPCLREMPLLQQAENMHGVKTIGISYETLPVIKAFTQSHPVTYSLYKSSFDIFYFMQAQGNRTAVLPYTVLIDADGAVINQKIGDFHTAEDINAFVQQSSAIAALPIPNRE